MTPFACPSCTGMVDAEPQDDWVCEQCGEVHLVEGPAPSIMNETLPMLSPAELASAVGISDMPRGSGLQPHAPLLARFIAGSTVFAGGVLVLVATFQLLLAGSRAFVPLVLAIGFATSAIGVGLVFFGVALWRGRRWSWYLYVVLQSLAAVGGTIQAVLGDPIAGLRAVLAVALLFYITRSAVRSFYGVARASP